MTNEQLEEKIYLLTYALSKQVPDMKQGFHISTNFGSLEVYPGEADRIIKAVERSITKRLDHYTKQLQKQQNKPGDSGHPPAGAPGSALGQEG